LDNVVISDGEKNGSLGKEYLNDIGVCRVFFRAACKPRNPWTRESERVLSRADLDWNRLTAYLTECGLARPLLGPSKGLKSLRQVPGFFVEQLETRASEDALADLMKREALRRIACVLRKVGGLGVLLKGTALQVLQDGRSGLPFHRATGDIDLYCDPPFGSALRRQLLEEGGFSERTDDRRTAPHHLAPVLVRGVVVEIHERIMPSFWGLPEREMLAQSRPVDGLDPLRTLSPEGLLLHAGVHASAHLFSNGLKAAWDLLWISSRFPELEWDLLARWIGVSRLPRGFWVPVRVLAQELSIPLPLEFLRRAPVDRRQLKLETIARHRLFSALERPFELNPFSRNGVFLLFHDSWLGWVRYLTAEARDTVRLRHPSQSLQRVCRQLPEALSQWRRYRRAHVRI
jgi:hypothetical protein